MHGGRVLNWRTVVLSATIVFCAVLGSHVNDDNMYVKDQDVFMKPVVVVPEPTIEEKIKEYFPRNWKTMIAVAHAESHMNMNAVGYNCYMNEDETIVYKTKVAGSHSGSCPKKWRSYAWSVDCFILQRNYPGRKTCPEGVTIDMHLRESAELSRVQGLSAWVTYNTKTHERYLATNK